MGRILDVRRRTAHRVPLTALCGAHAGLAARLLAVPLASLVLMILATSARAYIYFSQGNGSSGPIGRANLDGTGLENHFIVDASCTGVAVRGTHIYWTNNLGFNRATIGRANVAGTDVKRNFISLHGDVGAIAVDNAYIYWTDTAGIGRANLDGTGVNRGFIKLTSGVQAVAVDASHIYWGDSKGIGRANLDGIGATEGFITATPKGGPTGIAVDSAHIYWTSFGSPPIGSPTGTIGRANLDGTAANPQFITGARSPAGIALDAAHIYWANYGSGAIGRANLTGSAVNQGFIRRASATDLAVDGRTAPSTHGPTYFFGSVAATIKMPRRSVQGEVIRPARIFLFADGSWALVRLRWTGWGSKVAHANGISSASNGNPSQAQGKRIKTPAQITLSSPGRFFGHEVYRCFRLTVPPPATDLHGCLTGLHGYWNFQ